MATIIYFAESLWNTLAYCRRDLGNTHEKLADFVVVDDVYWYEAPEKRKAAGGR